MYNLLPVKMASDVMRPPVRKKDKQSDDHAEIAVRQQYNFSLTVFTYM